MTSIGIGRGGFAVGGVLSRSLSILRRNILPFFLLAASILSPIYLYVLLPESVLAHRAFETLYFDTALLLLAVILYPAVEAALAYGTLQELRGRHSSLRDSVVRGVAVMFSVLGIAIVVGLSVGLGLVALIVPGIFLMAALWVAIPVAVVERSGVIASLGRSWELTRGYRWQIFGIALVIGVLEGAILYMLELIAESLDADTSWLIAEWFVSALFGAFSAVVSAVSYHDLRVVKEGVGIDVIAAVFD